MKGKKMICHCGSVWFFADHPIFYDNDDNAYIHCPYCNRVIIIT